MDLNEYNSAITNIHEELQRLSEQIAQQGIIGGVDTSDPLFTAIMHCQRDLINLATKLNERMLSEMENQ